MKLGISESKAESSKIVKLVRHLKFYRVDVVSFLLFIGQ